MSEAIAFTPQMLAVILLLGLAIYLFVSEVVRVDVAGIIVMVMLGLTGLVPSSNIFDGFASNAVISIIAVMIMGAGLDRTGIMSDLTGYILRVGGSTERRVIPIISATVGVISSFMQNIGAAALFLPVMSRISTRTGIPLSRLLMPMGFCAILGGTLTMIGSSPLIMLNDLIANSNRSLPAHVEPMRTFDLFSVTPVGVAVLAAGIGYFMLWGRGVLPAIRTGAPDPGATAQYFENLYGLSGDIFEARVPLESPLVGMTVGEAEMLTNAPFILAMRSNGELRLEPPADERISAGAVFALMGEGPQIRDYRREQRLELRAELSSFIEALSPSRAGIAELVIPPGSNVIGKSARELRMRKVYGANLLAIYREEEILRKDRSRDAKLRAGDTLVVHSGWDDLYELSRDVNFVVVTDFPREVMRAHKVLHALIFFLLAIGLALFTDLRLSLALLVGALGMIMSGVLTIDEAYRSIGWQSVFLLASLLPLGVAVETTGTAAWLAQETLVMLGDVPAWILQTTLAMLATAFTLVMTNVGATVLLVPLAVNIALGAGADPAVFALTVALATSNSFLIPTHQVNALIMGPAGYRVADFMRAGGPMTVIFLVVLIVMLNVVF